MGSGLSTIRQNIIEEKKSWVDIRPELTYELQLEWYKQKFTPEQTQKWIISGLTIHDAKFAAFLHNYDYRPEDLNKDNLENERKKFAEWKSWDDIIHEDFGKECLLKLDSGEVQSKTYQQLWEEKNLTIQDAQEWIAEGFKPADYQEVKQWKKCNFAPQEAKSWIDIGLNSWYHPEFVAYLRNKGYRPSQNLNWEQLRLKEFSDWSKESKTTREYLDVIYPKEQRNAIKELDINSKNLTGSLDLSGFVSLEELNCHSNRLTNLGLTNCYQLKRLDCSANSLQDLKLPSSSTKQLTYLNITNNNFPEQDLSIFSHLINLKSLEIGNGNGSRYRSTDPWWGINQGIYNRFYGSLKPLKNLTKLRELNINNTDIDSGLEYLPENLEDLYCSANPKKDAKVKEIHQALRGKSLKQWKEEWKDKKEKYLVGFLGKSQDIQKNIHQFFSGYSNQEVSKLKDPQQVESRANFIWWTKLVGRFASASGGAVSLAGGFLKVPEYSLIGGGIGLAYPLIDFGISEWEKEFVKSNESKWEAFVKESKQLWGDYQGLRDALEFVNYLYKTDRFLHKDDKQSIKKLTDDIKDLEEKLEKKKTELEEKNQSLFPDKEILVKIETEKMSKIEKELAEKKREKSYQLWFLQEKIKEFFEKEKVENEELITKNQFAQNLQKNWNERKNQWKEIGEILVELSKEYQKLNDNGSANETESKKIEKPIEAKHQESQEWFNTFPDLDSEKDLDFILWLKNEKSKDLENFSEPQWIKTNADIDELKKAYQQKKATEQKHHIVDFQGGVDLDEYFAKKEQKETKTPERLQEENALLSQRVKELEKQVQQVAQILQPTNQPYGKPSSSKN